MAFTVTWPRPELTARMRTARTTLASSSRTRLNSPESIACTLITTSISSAPSATASLAASTFTLGTSAPKGNEMTEQTLTSAERRSP